jgi:hypothetical protein
MKGNKIIKDKDFLNSIKDQDEGKVNEGKGNPTSRNRMD